MDEDNLPKRKVSAWYFLGPLFSCILFLLIEVIVNVNTPKNNWYDNFAWVFLILLATSLFSGIMYYALANKIQPKKEREFFSIPFMKDLIIKRFLSWEHKKV